MKSELSGGIRTFTWSELPPGWQFDLLGTRCSVRRGASPRPAGDPRYFGGQIPWFKIGDATRSGSRFLGSTEEFVNQAGAAHSVRVPPGSLLVSNSGVSLGFAVITTVEGCIHDGWLLLSDFRNVDRDYLYYAINYFTKGIRNIADGTTQPNLNTDIARRLVLPFPSLAEQRSISGLFGTLDDKIELNLRMNETLEGVARAIFKSWFGDCYPIPASAAGTVPFSSIASIRRETVDPSEFLTESFDHYSLPAFDEARLPTVEMGAQIKSNKFVVPEDSVLLSKLNPRIPRVWMPLLRAGRRAICSTEFLVLEPKDSCYREYLYDLCTSQSFRDVFATLVTGTSGSHQRVKPEYLEQMLVVAPSRSGLKSYIEVVRPLHGKVAQNLRENFVLAALRDAILPKLMSGAIRIKGAEKIVEAHA